MQWSGVSHESPYWEMAAEKPRNTRRSLVSANKEAAHVLHNPTLSPLSRNRQAKEILLSVETPRKVVEEVTKHYSPTTKAPDKVKGQRNFKGLEYNTVGKVKAVLVNKASQPKTKTKKTAATGKAVATKPALPAKRSNPNTLFHPLPPAACPRPLRAIQPTALFGDAPPPAPQ